MSTERAGIFIHPPENGSAGQIYEETLALIQAAEEEGIHCVWVSQLHFQAYRGRLSSPSPFLVRAADRTRRIQLASGVITLPFENPLRLAEDAAVTNTLLRERLSFGVGAGEPVAGEFAPFGVPFEERHGRSEANLTTLLRALRGEALPPRGAFLQPPGGNLAQRIWWATGTQPRAAWAARHGVNLLLNIDQTRRGVPISQTNADAAAAYRDAWQGTHDPQVGIWRIVSLGDDENDAMERYLSFTESEARENFRRGLMKGVTTFEELRDHHQRSEVLIKGSPAQVVERLRREEAEIGFTDFLFYFTFADLKIGQRIELLRRLAREVASPLGWLSRAEQPEIDSERILQAA